MEEIEAPGGKDHEAGEKQKEEGKEVKEKGKKKKTGKRKKRARSPSSTSTSSTSSSEVKYKAVDQKVMFVAGERLRDSPKVLRARGWRARAAQAAKLQPTRGRLYSGNLTGSGLWPKASLECYRPRPSKACRI